MNNLVGSFNGLCLLAFVGVKVGGTAFALWSWWWLLMPAAPVLCKLLLGGGW